MNTLQAYRLLSRQLALRADRYSPELVRQASAAVAELCEQVAALAADNRTLAATVHKLATDVAEWTFNTPPCPACGTGRAVVTQPTLKGATETVCEACAGSGPADPYTAESAC